MQITQNRWLMRCSQNVVQVVLQLVQLKLKVPLLGPKDTTTGEISPEVIEADGPTTTGLYLSQGSLTFR